jgi:hypothetical protein
MKRLVLALLLWTLALIAPAFATQLLSVTITTAVGTTTTTPLQIRRMSLPTTLLLNCKFTYGSGGTTADAYVQTSLDGGVTWLDIAQFHLTTSSQNFVYNLSSATPVTTEYTGTDGSLGANTSKDGVLGPLVRVKWSTTGTYAGGTTLVVNAFATNGLTTQ